MINDCLRLVGCDLRAYGERLLMGMGFFSWSDKNVLELDSGDRHITVTYTKKPLNFTLYKGTGTLSSTWFISQNCYKKQNQSIWIGMFTQNWIPRLMSYMYISPDVHTKLYIEDITYAQNMEHNSRLKFFKCKIHCLRTFLEEMNLPSC